VIAIKDGKISYAGADKDAVKSDSVIDLGGKILMPGFMDKHTHFLSGGLSPSCVQLKESKTRVGSSRPSRITAARIPAI
jgi:predicted amidohydrolase YtcJ